MQNTITQSELSETDRDAILEALNDCFTQRYHSAAGYMLEAGSYLGAGDGDLRRAIEEIAAWDQAKAEELADVIESLDGIPQVRPYSHKLAELNYLSLRYMGGVLVRLLEEQSHDCAKAAVLAKRLFCPAAHETLASLKDYLDLQIPRLRLLLDSVR